jgi:hypothetical protein
MEHVPPKCLFPETKDLGRQYRNNLITVPSCDEHNSRKSADDEFLMASLAGLIGNNSVGFRHKFTKVNRAIYRSKFALLDQAMSEQRWEYLKVGPNQYLDVLWGKPNYDRLNTCLDRIARGLYYAYFSKKFFGSTKAILAYVGKQAQNQAEFQRFIRDKFIMELDGKPRLGDNPDIFSFQFTEPDRFGLLGLHAQFYGGLDVYMSLIPSSAQLPQNFAMELIEMNVPTTITLGEKEYRFNTHAQ